MTISALTKYLFNARKMFSSSAMKKAFDAITVNKQHFLRIIHRCIITIVVCMTSWFTSHYVVLLTYIRPTNIYFIYDLKVYLNTPPKKCTSNETSINMSFYVYIITKETNIVASNSNKKKKLSFAKI